MTIKQTAGHDALGEFAPEFAHLNDDILFGEVWNREDKLPLKLRSIVTVSALIGKGITDSSLKYHLGGFQHGQGSLRRRREPNRVAPRHKT
ncbi:carboxymuconolactone decarboxylase family protein [Collinsella aerofaciens]|uniref:carboxymuconolactone decarboxylase family protein n=1 Tax=Collinsella aerofaciens TaxID=74426 RepID=UPI0034A3460D